MAEIVERSIEKRCFIVIVTETPLVEIPCSLYRFVHITHGFQDFLIIDPHDKQY